MPFLQCIVNNPQLGMRDIAIDFFKTNLPDALPYLLNKLRV